MTIKEWKLCDVEIEMILFVLNRSIKMPIPPNDDCKSLYKKWTYEQRIT